MALEQDNLGELAEERRKKNLSKNEFTDKQQYPPNVEGETIDSVDDNRRNALLGINEYTPSDPYPENNNGDMIDTFDDIRRNTLLSINEYSPSDPYPENNVGDTIDTYDDIRRNALLGINEYSPDNQYPENNVGDTIDTFDDDRRNVLTSINQYNESNTYDGNTANDPESIDTYDDARRGQLLTLNEYTPANQYPENNNGDTIDTFDDIRRNTLLGINEYSPDNQYPENISGDDIDTFDDIRREILTSINQYNENNIYDGNTENDEESIDTYDDVRREQSLALNEYTDQIPYSNGNPNLISDGDDKGRDTNPLTGEIGNFYDIQQRIKSFAVNLYSPQNIYDLSNPKFLQTISQLADLIDLVPSNTDLANTFLFRALEIGPQTPMIKIANNRLIKAFEANIARRVDNEILPSINPGAILDGIFGGDDGDEPIISFPSDYTITKPSGFLTAAFYVEQLTGVDITPNPFNKDVNYLNEFGRQTKAIDDGKYYLQNTGKEQIRQLVKNLGRNQYSPYYDERRFRKYLLKYDTKQNSVLMNNKSDRQESQRSYLVNDSPSAFKSYYNPNPVTETDLIKNSVNSQSPLEFANMLKAEGFGDYTSSGKLAEHYDPILDQRVNEVTGNLAEGAGVELPDADTQSFTWGLPNQNETHDIRRGLLYYVNKVVDSGHPIKKMISQIPEEKNSCGFGSKSFPNQFSEKGISRGVNNLFCSDEDRRLQIYCRSWTKVDQYNRYDKLVRDGRKYRQYPDEDFEYSVMTDIGKPRIHPANPVKIGAMLADGTIKDKTAFDRNMKRLMLSIENLAWIDNSAFLPACEKGSNGGRIMWFPPYNLNFSEDTSTDYSETRLFGRPEAIYTYNSSTRSMNLSFTVISDYPSIINKIDRSDSRNDAEWRYNSYFWGCGDNLILNDDTPNNTPTVDDENNIDSQIQQVEQQINEESQITPVDNTDFVPQPITGVTELNFYFENDVHIWSGNSYNTMKTSNGEVVLYESVSDRVNYGTNGGFSYKVWDGGAIGTVYMPAPTNNQQSLIVYTSNGVRQVKQGVTRQYFGLNTDTIQNMPQFLDQIKNNNLISLEIKGYASKLNTAPYNEKLSRRRAESVRDMLLSQVNGQRNFTIKIEGLGEPEPQNEGDDSVLSQWAVVDKESTKRQRLVNVKLVVDPSKVEAARNNQTEQTRVRQQEEEQARNQRVADLRQQLEDLKRAKALMDNANAPKRSCYYFDEIPDNQQPFFYEKMRQRIDYFHPAFHSQTPEDLNKRLTFLQQCTRPGTPLSGNKTGENTLFGRPPICVLRIGDFFHTRAILQSVSIDYNVDGGPIFDKNPEGIGIQPLMANLSLSLKLIGGSSLKEPINRIQNALSSNYYANAQFYDPAAFRQNPSTTPTDKINLNIPQVDSISTTPPATTTTPNLNISNVL